MTLRIENGLVDVTDGPFAETQEILGGILMLEAPDLNHAVSLMSKHPGVKIGPFEIRPAAVEINAMVAERQPAFDKETNLGEWLGSLSIPAIAVRLTISCLKHTRKGIAPCPK